MSSLDVSFQVALLGKGKGTKRTDERPFSAVLFRVSLERVLLVEGLFATRKFAGKRFFSSVNSNVSLEQTWFTKGAFAKRAVLLVRP